MSALWRVVGCLAALAVVLAGGWFVGSRVGVAAPAPEPVDSHAAESGGHGGSAADGSAMPDDHQAGNDHDHADSATGTSAHSQGYGLTVLTPLNDPGPQELRFVISGPDGAPVQKYATFHERELHLILVREDLSGFQHVHPRRQADGVWSVTVDLTSGPWRMYADVQPADHDQLTLGAPLTVRGATTTVAVPPPRATAEVDGYTVQLATTPQQGAQQLAFTVSRQGVPVTDLQRYLGAYGHLVVLRSHDMAYLHAHPTSTTAGPLIEAQAHYPSNGRYRVYLEFQHADRVHRAEFTVEVP